MGAEHKDRREEGGGGGGEGEEGLTAIIRLGIQIEAFHVSAML